MAKILFLMRYPLDKWDNLKNKFDGQMAAVEALGHEAYCIGWNGEGLWLCRGREREALLKTPLTALPVYDKTLFYADLMRALCKAVQRHKFDVAYIRYIRLFGNAPAALKLLKEQGCKLVLEHPTYPFENGKVTSLWRKPFFDYCDRVFERIEPLLDLYTLIGDPCGDTLGGIPAMNILNGVDVQRLALHAPRTADADIGLLALASMSRWQGYDRLIRALACCREREHVTVHMVGGEGDGSLAAWRRLAQELGVENRVQFHGELFGKALDRVAAMCDVGVGGLGLYRKAQYQSMTLKLREYMARGLPFVYAVDDPSVPDEPRFCLRLSNDEAPIDMDEIIAFARRTRADEAAPADMRAYAEKHMSWRGVMASVLERVGVACPKA